MSVVLAGGERRAAAFALPGMWAAAAALVALGLAAQLKFGMMADVAWLIDCDERWLAGAVPYRDFFEINPPASLLLYLPAVAAAKLLGVSSEAAVTAFGFLAAAAAIGLSAAILRRAAGPAVLLAAIVAFVALPGQTFCERDHLAALFGVPFLSLALARAERAPVPLALALIAGAGAGVMAAIKPPYALIGLMLAAYVWLRVGRRAVLKAPEYYVAAALGLAYLACVEPVFPYYVANALPIGVNVYLPARESLIALLASPGALLALLILSTAALAAGARGRSSGFAVAALATLGAAAAYLIQGKAWVYQAVPAMMFATLAGGFACEAGPRRPLALAAGAASAAVAVSATHSLGLAFALGLAAGFAVEAGLARDMTPSAPRLAPLAFAAAVGAACGVCVIERPLTPALERDLVALGPHLRLGAVSQDMGLGFPLARRIGATWAMRANSLYVTSAVDHLLAEYPRDEALRRRLAPYAEAERSELVEDIRASRPDALLVGPVNTRLHAEVFADPRLQAAMADYERVAVEDRPGYKAELWLRKDFAAKR